MDKQMIIKPRLSEKSFKESQATRTYAFEVPGDANKHSVARAVAAQFEVTVTNVNMTNIKGKPQRTVRKGGRAIVGRRSDLKKAYVTLAEGNSLPFFAAEEAEIAKAEKAAEKATKADKKADKKTAKKETK